MLKYNTQADNDGNENGLTAVLQSDVTDVELERLAELNTMFADIGVHGRDYEGILVIGIEDEDSTFDGEYFWIYSKGQIARANVNQPRVFKTFVGLLSV